MMPEEWPTSDSASGRNAPARRAGSGRLATVRADFFLDPAERLSEQERALMTAMLHHLVGEIADELRAALPAGWAAANDESNAALIDRLSAARLLDEPDLMALLLRRADEERIVSGARARGGRRDARALQGLVSHDDGAVSAAAMALILARGRRRDRFGQQLLSLDDLGFASAEQLVQASAAALREEITASRGPGEADAALAAAAEDRLGRIDAERGVDGLTAALVTLLDEKGALDDALLLAAAREGEIAFIAQALAGRGGIPASSAIDELLSGDPERVTAVLRATGASRELAAGLLAAIGDLLGIADPGEAIATFDAMTDAAAVATRAWLSTAPAYRSALQALGEGHGKRPK
jgi:hypothetical protein